MYFHSDNPTVIDNLAEALSYASTNYKRVRFDVDEAGSLKVKIGEGIWSAPIASTPDPYRDNYGGRLPVEPPIGYRWATPDEVDVSLNSDGPCVESEVWVYVGVDTAGSKCYDLAVPKTEGN